MHAGHHRLVQARSVDRIDWVGDKLLTRHAEVALLCMQGITGSFRPGVLTALIGASGAGKTTLMDVLADRKTGQPS